MLSQEQKNDIFNKVMQINQVSEGYQLIHACFAAQKIINDQINESYKKKFAELREQLLNAGNDDDTLTTLLNKKKELEIESRKSRINISVQYTSSLTGKNATTTRVGTYKNTFTISLSDELRNIRNEDGTFDYEKMKALREVMAHELGHIVLHADCINEEGLQDIDANKEEESDFFSETVLELRKKRNKLFYSSKAFETV